MLIYVPALAIVILVLMTSIGYVTICPITPAEPAHKPLYTGSIMSNSSFAGVSFNKFK